MNAVYDHIIAILVVGAIFVGTVVVMPTMSFINLQAVDQQQLRNTALNVFNAMLLGTGCPSDWGSTFPFDQNNVETFGLAYSEECSMYVLDTDKVQRLDKDSPGYITYEKARERLKLENYGFSLTIFRPFIVDWDLQVDKTANYVWFAVNVTRNQDGRPIPNAEVVSTIIYSAKNETDEEAEPLVGMTTLKNSFTNALGRCEGNETIEIPEGLKLVRAVAVLRVTVAGMPTIAVAEEDETMHVMKINTFGDNMILSFRNDSVPTSGARWILNIMAYSHETLTPIYEGTPDDKLTWGYGYYQWYKTFPGLSVINPPLLLFTVSVPLGKGGGGRVPVIVVGPFSFWDSSKVLSFGPDSEQVSNVAVKLRRFVVISGMTYIAELTLWKE
ncbi:hypothetical protein KAU92_02325 [Candidatus Bathyarchaeota archaeon]|nr:hypothetical protein [Candidatus Bathyarchaeota archaeon]